MNIKDTLLAQDFVDSSNVFDLNDDVVRKTIELRKNHKIKLPDAIIAATALIYDLTVLTRNTTDFNKISGLVLNNVFDLF